MKKLLLLVPLIFVFSSCINEPGSMSFATGTVKYESIEGGFYGIVAKDNSALDPINLPDEYKIDGLKIEFSYVTKNGYSSIHMWGTIIEIITVKKMN